MTPSLAHCSDQYLYGSYNALPLTIPPAIAADTIREAAIASFWLSDPGYAQRVYQPLQKTLNELTALLSLEKAAGKYGRKARKLNRKIALCRACLHIHWYCIPLISPYTQKPEEVIDRFWNAMIACGNLALGIVPDIKLFFEWYCDSRTITAERAANKILCQ